MGKRGGKSAYRGGGAEGRGASAAEGLVGDIVRQFADPYAFFRELVQNAIDAGASKIAIRLVHDEAEQLTRISVEDDGSGMSAEILEGDLTVLFKSTKESRDDAIGKFGIGFVSVLALAPTLVAVDTSLGDGVRHRLELYRDHTYDLLRAAGKTKGTTVTLHVPTSADELPERIARSRASLSKWCMHARIPITFAVHTASERSAPERIDRALELRGALLSVTGVSRDRRTEVVVGLGPSPGARGAFYNRGLLLHESDEVFAGVGPIWFKVADGRLEHTLSRDDVRRDAHFLAVLEQVRRMVEGPLLDAVHQRMRDADLPTWRAHFDAASAAGLGLRTDLCVPLAAPIRGARSWPLSNVEPLIAGPVDAGLLDALTTEGIGVLALEPRHDGQRMSELSRIAGRTVEDAAEAFATIEPVTDDALVPLLEPIAALLRDVARKPPAIALARFGGGASGTLALGLAPPPRRQVLRIDALRTDPFRMLMRPPLLLHVDHPVMIAAAGALGRAVSPATIAALVVRAILEERALLDPDRRALLLRCSIERALDGAR